jgi:hypothetical protein
MSKPLRSGKAKRTLESAVDSALLAVEIYNKPRAQFRSQAYISLMIIAWTNLFHAYFLRNIGDKFYYKDKRGKKYLIIDGERKAWEIKACIEKYGKLKGPVAINLDFFIKLRNKIEHRHIDKNEVDIKIFGECQALLFNFESFLIENFGEQYALSQNLVYSIQFSQIRSNGQIKSNKSALASDIKDLQDFVDTYRNEMSGEIYDSQEFSIKLIQIPNVSNTNRCDLAVEFVPLNSLSEEDKALYDQITVLVKDKRIKVEGTNIGKLKPGLVVFRVNELLGPKTLNIATHTRYYTVFNVRPKSGAEDPFETNPDYCHYDEAHKDYVYNEKWVDFIVEMIRTNTMGIDKITEASKANIRHDPEIYLL